MQLVKFEKSIKPPPSKAEIIEALIQVKLEEINSARAKLIKEHEELSKVAEIDLLEFAKINFSKLKSSVGFGYKHGGTEINGTNVTLSLTAKLLPKPLLKKISAAIDARDAIPRSTTYESVKKQIKDQVAALENKSARIQSLIASPDARRVLEETLVHLAKS